MNVLETVTIDCPACGERIDLLVDCSLGDQEYIEDCSVCCQPLNLRITINEHAEPSIQACSENDIFSG